MTHQTALACIEPDDMLRQLPGVGINGRGETVVREADDVQSGVARLARSASDACFEFVECPDIRGAEAMDENAERLIRWYRGRSKGSNVREIGRWRRLGVLSGDCYLTCTTDEPRAP
jgi:hypothetical protein